MVNIEPTDFQYSTAFKERMDLLDKVNEIIDVINDTSGGIQPESTYGIIPITILYPVGTGVRVTGRGHGIISGVVGMEVNGVARHVPITYYASPLMPDSVICDVISSDSGLQFIKATIDGTVENHTLEFKLVDGEGETPLTVTMARISMLRRI